MSYATTSATEKCEFSTQNCGTRERKTGRIKSIVQTYIAEHFKPLRHAAYHLANAAQIDSIRTAEGWLSGRSWPRDDDLLELCISCTDLQMQLHDLAMKTRLERSSK